MCLKAKENICSPLKTKVDEEGRSFYDTTCGHSYIFLTLFGTSNFSQGWPSETRLIFICLERIVGRGDIEGMNRRRVFVFLCPGKLAGRDLVKLWLWEGCGYTSHYFEDNARPCFLLVKSLG